MHVYSIEKKYSLVLEISIRTYKIFKYFVNLSKQKWRLVGHFEFDPDETSQDSWEDCNKCMCKVSEKNIQDNLTISPLSS